MDVEGEVVGVAVEREEVGNPYVVSSGDLFRKGLRHGNAKVER
jgi:hypothetical protein